MSIEDVIICGECASEIKKLDDESIDLVVTSPPYDDLRKYNGYSWNFEDVATGLSRVIKRGGVIVWVVGDKTVGGSETGRSMKQALFFKDQCGLLLYDTMIYRKHNPVPTGKGRYYQSWEFMFVFSKGRPKTFNPIFEPRRNACNDKRTHRVKSFNRSSDGVAKKVECKIRDSVPRQNVWTYKVGGGNSTKDRMAHGHPAIFPSQLAADHIQSWSNHGDLVLDPFCGSGTTVIEAKKMERKYIGIEISEEYCNLIKKRMDISV